MIKRQLREQDHYVYAVAKSFTMFYYTNSVDFCVSHAGKVGVSGRGWAWMGEVGVGGRGWAHVGVGDSSVSPA